MLGIAPALVFGAISSLVGGLVMMGEFRDYWLSLDSEEWPVVEGEIEETGVVTSIGVGSNSATTFAPLVRYHYRVGDRQYVSDRLSFGGVLSTSFRGWAARIADRYGQQRTVKVRVSPKDPATAVLEPGVHWSCWLGIAIGAVFLGLGIVGLLSYFGVMHTSTNFH